MVASDKPRGGNFLAVLGLLGRVEGLTTVAAWLHPAKAAIRAQARRGVLIFGAISR